MELSKPKHNKRQPEKEIADTRLCFLTSPPQQVNRTPRAGCRACPSVESSKVYGGYCSYVTYVGMRMCFVVMGGCMYLVLIDEVCTWCL
ncbi:hypothetical protein P280DRAFT_470055 [Massarina eburnea CBS 473.64]|uniref:Uncharacterized protein n=1 Tax=Massarina eburnea CBS 473.64 TaxID=1395130 RepID=A0A6A6S007_9PLEO|nr:hypothetical protein P280DRAFT_470055 [Massarina eburnea CBS 473.64]